MLCRSPYAALTFETRSVCSGIDCGSIRWVGLHRGLLRGTPHPSFDNKRDLQKNAALSMKTPGEDFFVKAVKNLSRVGQEGYEPCHTAVSRKQDKGRMGKVAYFKKISKTS